jgi:cystathionine gamma-synthase
MLTLPRQLALRSQPGSPSLAFRPKTRRFLKELTTATLGMWLMRPRHKASCSHLTLSKRFFIGKPIRSLIIRVKQRLKVNSNDLVCFIFPSPDDANDYAVMLREKSAEVHHVRFSSPGPVSSENGDDQLSFSALLLPSNLKEHAMSFWVNFGTGITTRHAEYCLKHFDELISKSPVDEFKTVATAIPSRDPSSEAWIQRGPRDLEDLKAHIAHLATSERSGLKCVEAGDVFVFPNGMNAIYNAAEAIAVSNPKSGVVAYG